MKTKHLTTGQAAALCGVHLKTVKRWIERGHLKSFQLPNSQNHRILVEDFVAFLNAHNMPVPEKLLSAPKPPILVVDDDTAMANSIRRLLRIHGHETVIAHDSFSAGMLLESHKPKLMTLDLDMPGVGTETGGTSVLRMIRSQPNLKHTKVVVISALSAEELAKAKSLGADAAIPKPFEPENLLKLIKKLAA